MTDAMAQVVIRDLDGTPELKEAERLQTTVWGEDDKPDNSDLLLAVQHEGGLVGGAFLDERMVGFIFAFPSATPGVQHSHRLAVHPDMRGLGLGARLKWFQRTWCLAREITRVRWTYDPLRAINATLNINRLGATAETYLVDYYGAMEGINAGLPSDRLLAEWQLDSDAVQGRAERRTVMTDPEVDRQIIIPADIDGLVLRSPEEALHARLSVRAQFMDAFAAGMRLDSFDPDACTYGLSRKL